MNQDQPKAGEGAPLPGDATSRRRKRVLIVDDSATMRMTLEKMLREDFDCTMAEDGAVGLQKALTDVPDAMVVDLEMPNVNGLELLQGLKSDARTRAVPVIIITTVMALKAVNECRALGCAGFALKPVDPSYLRAKLLRLLAPAGPGPGPVR